MRRMGMFGAMALLLSSLAAAPERASAQDGEWTAGEAVARQALVFVMGDWRYEEVRVGADCPT